MANRLTRTVSSMEKAPLPWPITKRVVKVPMIEAKVNILSTSISTWASTVAKYPDEGKLLEAKEDAQKIRRKATRFLLINGILYKKSFSTLLLRYISV